MSLIRFLNNPEELYIWHDISNRIAIMCSKQLGADIWYIPLTPFIKIAKKYYKTGRSLYTPIKIGSVTLSEVFIQTKKKTFVMLGKEKLYDGDTKIRLRCRNKKIDMWGVTWDYIVKNVLWQYKSRNK